MEDRFFSPVELPTGHVLIEVPDPVLKEERVQEDHLLPGQNIVEHRLHEDLLPRKNGLQILRPLVHSSVIGSGRLLREKKSQASKE